MSDIQIEHLAAGYGRLPVLLDTTLAVRGGSLTCVLGASGCGKTTLLRVVAGFEPAQSGTVRIGGRTVDDSHRRVAAERRNVGYVPQDGALFPHLTIDDNIGFALSRRTRESRAARRHRIDELLDLVAMRDLGSRHPHQLSGGQQQRVAVARALARNPEVVLLDEPFASLDASLRARLRDDIRAVLRTAGVTAVLVTHDRSEALSLGDQVAVMREGRIIQAGPPDELYTAPVDAETAAFVSDATMLDADVDSGVATTALGRIAIDPKSPVTHGRGRAVLRPEQLRVTPEPVCNGATGVVTKVEYFGHDARVELTLRADNGETRVVARTAGSALPAIGSTVGVGVDAPIWIVAATATTTTTTTTATGPGGASPT